MTGKVVVILLGCGLPAWVHGQLDCTFELGNDTTICEGQQVVLSAPPGTTNLLWSTGEASPTITVDLPGTYSLTASTGEEGAELVVNGDFSDGTTGFTSAYQLAIVPGPFGLLSNEGMYVVMTDPQLAHVDFASCGDHTTGSGNMMVVNGAAVAGIAVWCQTVAVEAGTTYAFSTWLMSAFATQPAILEFTINGVSLGDPFTASSQTCVWEEFTATWNSGGATTAELCIVNQNTAVAGNDFALDDISFLATCTLTASIEVAVTEQLPVDLGPDTLLCGGSGLVLDPGFPEGMFLWQDGSTEPTYTVTTSGTYSVSVEYGGCSGDAQVEVEMHPQPQVVITGDTLICSPEGALLTAVTDAMTIAWQDGSMGSTFTALVPGTYTVTVEHDGCSDSAAVEVQAGVPAEILVLGDTLLCEPAAVELLAVHGPGGPPVWQDGSEASSFIADGPGTYYATVNTSCGTATDSAVVRLGLFEPPVDRVICPGTIVTVSLVGAATEVLWEDGSTDLMRELGEGEHAFALTDEHGCARSGTIVFRVDEQADGLVFVPNAFTPNNDGLNDDFRAGNAEREGFSLMVFDRWGAVVFSSSDPLEGWDGTFNGRALPAGAYAYVMRSRDACGAAGVVERTGHVLLVR
jgi:gliding motility-associated-like protein